MKVNDVIAFVWPWNSAIIGGVEGFESSFNNDPPLKYIADIKTTDPSRTDVLFTIKRRHLNLLPKTWDILDEVGASPWNNVCDLPLYSDETREWVLCNIPDELEHTAVNSDDGTSSSSVMHDGNSSDYSGWRRKKTWGEGLFTQDQLRFLACYFQQKNSSECTYSK